MAAAVYKCFSTSMEAVPFLASAAGIAANFCLITFALALQSTDMPLDVEMGLSEVELDLFTTLAHILPSLCPLDTNTTLPKLDQLLGDLVGAEEILAPEGKEIDKERAMTSTTSEGAARTSRAPSSFSKSRSATPSHSHEASPSPIKSQVAIKGAMPTNTFTSQTTSRFLPKYMPTLMGRR